jgi:GNAT superfamily N-acetyltransferase
MAFTIRAAAPHDADEISKLIVQLSIQFVPDRIDAGVDRFMNSIAPAAIAANIADPRFIYLVALQGTELVGVIGFRDGTHLLHMFVHPDYQGRGISRQLWESALSSPGVEGEAKGFTLNSTLSAVPVYERLGFAVSGPKIDLHGIVAIPMTKLGRSQLK